MTEPSLYRKIIAGQTGPWAAPVRGLLALLSIPYEMAIAWRNRRYDRHGPQSVLPVPVISVGNLTVGGTGKTPLVIAIVRQLERMGFAPAVIARGYGARSGESNDEELLIRRHCPNITYVTDPDRIRGAELAIRRHGATVVVLDDGFQHRRLGRTLDIVVIDATCPFGYGRLLPRGLLREPPRSLQRAHVVVVSRCDQVAASQLAELDAQLHKLSPQALHLHARHRMTGLVRLDGTPWSGSLTGLRVAAFAAIGNPQSFVNTIQSLGAVVVGSRFWPDHHSYRAEEIHALSRGDGFSSCDLFLTTEKDAVKLNLLSELDPSLIGVVRVEIDFIGQGDRMLQDALNALGPQTENSA